jgi:hypothetical protein
MAEISFRLIEALIERYGRNTSLGRVSTSRPCYKTKNNDSTKKYFITENYPNYSASYPQCCGYTDGNISMDGIK